MDQTQDHSMSHKELTSKNPFFNSCSTWDLMFMRISLSETDGKMSLATFHSITESRLRLLAEDFLMSCNKINMVNRTKVTKRSTLLCKVPQNKLLPVAPTSTLKDPVMITLMIPKRKQL